MVQITDHSISPPGLRRSVYHFSASTPTLSIDLNVPFYTRIHVKEKSKKKTPTITVMNLLSVKYGLKSARFRAILVSFPTQQCMGLYDWEIIEIFVFCPYLRPLWSAWKLRAFTVTKATSNQSETSLTIFFLVCSSLCIHFYSEKVIISSMSSTEYSKRLRTSLLYCVTIVLWKNRVQQHTFNEVITFKQIFESWDIIALQMMGPRATSNALYALGSCSQSIV